MKLREARLKLGLSQYEVAEALSCSQVVYSRYETGIREPSIEVLKKLSEIYGVSIDYLVENNQKTEVLISKEEQILLETIRKADKRSIQDAVLLLEAHKKI